MLKVYRDDFGSPSGMRQRGLFGLHVANQTGKIAASLSVFAPHVAQGHKQRTETARDTGLRYYRTPNDDSQCSKRAMTATFDDGGSAGCDNTDSVMPRFLRRRCSIVGMSNNDR